MSTNESIPARDAVMIAQPDDQGGGPWGIVAVDSVEDDADSESPLELADCQDVAPISGGSGGALSTDRDGVDAGSDRLKALFDRPGCLFRFCSLNKEASKAIISRRVKQTAQERQHPALGVLQFACSGRGRGFYGGEHNVDCTMLHKASPTCGIAGMFCAGEIGPAEKHRRVGSFDARNGFNLPADAAGSPKVGAATTIQGFTTSWMLVYAPFTPTVLSRQLNTFLLAGDHSAGFEMLHCAAPPKFSPSADSGAFVGSVVVVLSCSTPHSQVLYTCI
jgi:hypothetical protein